MRGATKDRNQNGAAGQFQLTRPLRGATLQGRPAQIDRDISTHTPLAGRDLVACSMTGSIADFNSHAPCGARPVLRRRQQHIRHFNSHAPCGARLLAVNADRRAVPFQLTRPLRGATRGLALIRMMEEISTHTPLAGRDKIGAGRVTNRGNFNSHAPCGARQIGISGDISVIRFQLTRPLRGATRRSPQFPPDCSFQLTRPLRGATGAARGGTR